MGVTLLADEVVPALERESARVAAMLRSVPDPSATAVGFWSVRDLAAHLSHVWELMAGALEGRESPVKRLEGLSDYYNSRVADDPEGDVERFADRLDELVPRIAAALRERPDGTGRWHAGIEVPRTVLAGVPLEEAIVHGRDIALAIRRPHRPPREHSALGLAVVAHLLPPYANEAETRGRHIVFRLHVRGGRDFDLVVDDGTIRASDTTDRKVDCHLVVDPLAFMLVGFNRIPVAKPVLRGQMLAYGRKPWLGLALPKMVSAP